MSLVENFLSYALRSAVIPVINGKDCCQFGAQLVGKQDWNPKRQCPALKIVLYGKFSVHLGTSGQVYSVLDFSPGPSVTWIRGWDRASLGSLLNTGLGFPFPWMQRGSRTETSLCLVLTQSQAITREWPRLGKRRSTLASWGFGVSSLTLSPPPAFVLHLLPQAGQSRKSTNSVGCRERRMMKKAVKVEKSRLKTTEGACELNRGEETAEEVRWREREWKWGMQKSDVWKSK